MSVAHSTECIFGLSGWKRRLTSCTANVETIDHRCHVRAHSRGVQSRMRRLCHCSTGAITRHLLQKARGCKCRCGCDGCVDMCSAAPWGVNGILAFLLEYGRNGMRRVRETRRAMSQMGSRLGNCRVWPDFMYRWVYSGWRRRYLKRWNKGRGSAT